MRFITLKKRKRKIKQQSIYSINCFTQKTFYNILGVKECN